MQERKILYDIENLYQSHLENSVSKGGLFITGLSLMRRLAIFQRLTCSRPPQVLVMPSSLTVQRSMRQLAGPDETSPGVALSAVGELGKEYQRSEIPKPATQEGAAGCEVNLAA